MSTERHKMLAGEMYDPFDPELVAARARNLCQDLNVQIYTPLHPFNAEQRRREEYGKPINIGSDVWVDGGAITRSHDSPSLQSHAVVATVPKSAAIAHGVSIHRWRMRCCAVLATTSTRIFHDAIVRDAP